MRKADSVKHIKCVKTNSHVIYVRMRDHFVAINVDAFVEVTLNSAEVKIGCLETRQIWRFGKGSPV